MKNPLKPINIQIASAVALYYDCVCINTDISTLTKQHVAQILPKFLLENPSVAHLKQIAILGLPANAIFASQDVCYNNSFAASVLFAASCGLSKAQIACALDKCVIDANWIKYNQNYLTGSHYFVQFTDAGRQYVADFTRQIVCPAEDYCKATQISPGQIVTAEVQDLELADIIEAYKSLSKRLAKLTSRQCGYQLQVDALIENLKQNKKNVYATHCLGTLADELKANDITDSYLADSYLFYAALNAKFADLRLQNLNNGKTSPAKMVDKVKLVYSEKHNLQELYSRAAQLLASLYPQTRQFNDMLETFAASGVWGE